MAEKPASAVFRSLRLHNPLRAKIGLNMTHVMTEDFETGLVLNVASAEQ